MLPTYTRNQVKLHNRINDCWITIGGNIYNVTSFLDEHPGGESVIMESAGADATLAFEQVFHSKEAHSLLSKYHIGTLGAIPSQILVKRSNTLAMQIAILIASISIYLINLWYQHTNLISV